MKEKWQIVLFLQRAKEYVRKHGIILVPRDGSLRFMTGSGMSIEQLHSLVFSLDESDCFDGPENDRDDRFQGWTVAEFASRFQGKRLYLKLSIKVESERCKCLSIKLYSGKKGKL